MMSIAGRWHNRRDTYYLFLFYFMDKLLVEKNRPLNIFLRRRFFIGFLIQLNPL